MRKIHQRFEHENNPALPTASVHEEICQKSQRLVVVHLSSSGDAVTGRCGRAPSTILAGQLQLVSFFRVKPNSTPFSNRLILTQNFQVGFESGFRVVLNIDPLPPTTLVRLWSLRPSSLTNYILLDHYCPTTILWTSVVSRLRSLRPPSLATKILKTIIVRGL